MSYQKCPRCNLNYISEGESVCRICNQELGHGASVKPDEEEELCVLCGENVVVKGKDLCSACLREVAAAKPAEPWNYTEEQDAADEEAQQNELKLPLIPRDGLDDGMDEEALDDDEQD